MDESSVLCSLRTESLLRELARAPSDSGLWVKFYLRYGPVFFHWCRSYGLQVADAEDVSQEILLKVRGGLKTYSPQAGVPARAWLRRIADHEVSDWCQKLARRRETMGEALNVVMARRDLLQALADEYDLELLEVAESIVRESLTGEHTWQSYELTKLQGLSAKEAGERLQISSDKVQRYATRVLARITREVARMMTEDDPSH